MDGTPYRYVAPLNDGSDRGIVVELDRHRGYTVVRWPDGRLLTVREHRIHNVWDRCVVPSRLPVRYGCVRTV